MQVSKLSQLKSILNNYEFFIIDEKVSTLYKEFLGPLDQSKCYFVSAPEQSKNMHEFEKICIFFLNQKIRRTDSLCIIGGGATSDLGGFVASSLLRGINWSVIPTTLLSMIDASIGGKVGINTTQGKNLIGSFHLPQKNYFIPEFLNTLEPDEYTSGLGELIKYKFIDKNIDISKPIGEVIVDCATFKQEIVHTDLKEKGIREILNFGHTFGHGIEKLTTLSHGMSVLYGIELNLFLFSPSLLKEFYRVLGHFEINLENIKLDINKFLDVVEHDKKNTAKEIGFIILDNNKAYATKKLSRDELKTLLESNATSTNTNF